MSLQGLKWHFRKLHLETQCQNCCDVQVVADLSSFVFFCAQTLFLAARLNGYLSSSLLARLFAPSMPESGVGCRRQVARAFFFLHLSMPEYMYFWQFQKWDFVVKFPALFSPFDRLHVSAVW
jgi:hypothetical protein